ncbi:MAG: 23S rRNA (guanosine(2251)-2'-O)-methyltransferase RlmB [Planctomycetaceae bacterium]|nr:23S rRNA (guanosine(2251)-2'-O)-methyltransferase RlmB [Planctomycetaceae bacterium]
MGNHQRAWLCGWHAVCETLRVGRWLPTEVRMAIESLDADRAEELQTLTRELDIPCHDCSASELEQLLNRRDHQGCAARMPDFPYSDWEKVLTDLTESESACVLVLDRIQDPHNFGAILRSAEIFGAAAVIVPEREQSGVNSQVVRSSAGAVNHLPLVRMPSLVDAVKQLQQVRFRAVAGSEKATCAPANEQLTGRIVLVVGNEGVGPSADLMECCDSLVAIPQSGQVDSLNVAVAAGILLYEVARQRSDSTSAQNAAPRSS